MPERAYAESVQLIAADGRTWQGAAAVERIIDLMPKGWLVSWVFSIPAVHPLAKKFYRWFARHRYRLGCGRHCQYRPPALDFEGAEARPPRLTPGPGGHRHEGLGAGGTGVVGPEAVRRLALRGHAVRLFSRHAGHARTSFEGGVEALDGDVGDADATRGAADGCDAALHLASTVAELSPDATVEVDTEPVSRPSRLEPGAAVTMALPLRGHVQVRVEEASPRSVTLATLEGRPLAGAVRFAAEPEGEGAVRFEVQTCYRARRPSPTSSCSRPSAARHRTTPGARSSRPSSSAAAGAPAASRPCAATSTGARPRPSNEGSGASSPCEPGKVCGGGACIAQCFIDGASQSKAVSTLGAYHVYELSVGAYKVANVSVDGVAALTRNNFETNGTVAIGDQTNDVGVDGAMRIRSAARVCP